MVGVLFKMRIKSFLSFLLFSLSFASMAFADGENGGSIPLRDSIVIGRRVEFVENLGQWQSRICFKSSAEQSTLFVEKDCFTYVLSEKDEHQSSGFHHYYPRRFHAYRMSFVGCQPTTPVGDGKSESYDNYFTSRSKANWRGHVGRYASVYYSNIYPNIDLRLYSASVAFKYDYIVKPGGDVSSIVMKYDGVDNVKLRRDGAVVLRTSVYDVVEIMPYAYQQCETGFCQVDAHYQVDGNEVRIVVGSYDSSTPLIIDPYVVFSTYTGSTADNWGTTATYDSYKNVYTAGLVFDIGYPVSLGAYSDTYTGYTDVGIFKFNPTGNQRLYATYLGGSFADMPHSMFVNAFDELVIYGTTGSADFPVTSGAFDTTFNGGTNFYYEASVIPFPNGSDIFVSRFSEDGSMLQASTFVGGSDNDGVNFRHEYNLDSRVLYCGNDSLYYNYGDGARGELIVDDQNNVYVGSTTFSTDFPVSASALQSQLAGRQEGVVFKLDYNLGNMLWSTYLGGSKDDAVYSLEVDEDYNLLACGGTASSDFPITANAYKKLYNGGSTDGFVAKISYNGDVLMQSSYFGSDAYDQCYFVRCGRNSDVFLFGQTKATGSTLIYNADYNMPGGGQFIAHLTPNLDSLVWSTVFGSPRCHPDISPTAFGADICNRVYAVGWGRDFVGYNGVAWNSGGTYKMEVTPDAFQHNTDGQDFYIMSLTMDASRLDYATFYGEINSDNVAHHGTDHVDGGTSRFDRLGCLYQSVCGSCSGTDKFPTTSGVWSEHSGQAVYGNCNNAVFRFTINEDFPLAEFSSVPVGCAPYTVEFHNTGRGSSFLWDFGDGTTSTDRDPVHVYDIAGEYNVKLIAYQVNGCTESDTMERVVRILSNTSRNMGEVVSCDRVPLQIGFKPINGCSYNWISGKVSDSTISNPYVEEQGEYVLQITADNGCQEIDTFNAVYYSIIDTLYVSAPVCYYDREGKAEVEISKYAKGKVVYVWDGHELPTKRMITIDSVRKIHTLMVYDSLCSAYRQFENFTPKPVVVREARAIICQSSDCNGFYSAQYLDPDSNRTYQYSWVDQPFISDYWRDSLCSGQYVLYVKDNMNCSYFDTANIIVTASFANIVFGADSVAFKGTDPHLHINNIEGATYEWEPATYIVDPTVPSPKVLIYDSTLYYVSVYDTSGCTYFDSVYVACRDYTCGTPDFFIPNAFTPNFDGQNDKLCFRGQDIVTDFHFMLFTRWGELVFETRDINDCWDGRYHDNDCLPGVYMYTCKITCVAGQTTSFKGDVTLIR